MSASGRQPRVVLAASVDTEEDNWTATRTNVTLANIAALPRMHEFMSRLGLRLTYFSAYSVVTDATAARVLEDLAAAGAEIGAHLHPWNTPPLDEAMLPRNTMLKNLPADLQRRKLGRLTDQMEATLGTRPTAFRAGRFALGAATADALIAQGYRVDSSVMPWIDWSDTDEGPDFFGAPQRVYRIASGTSVTAAAATGALIEVPMSTGFSRWPFSRWARIHRRLGTGVARRLHLTGIAARTGLVRRILLSPEGTDTREMLQLARVLVSHGVEHLQIMWHSPSLLPGLTPFARTQADVDLLLRKVAEFVDGLHSFASITFATVSETAARLAANGAGEAPRA